MLQPAAAPSRPHNHARTLFHVLGGVVMLFVIDALGAGTVLRLTAALCTAFMWTMELARARFPGVNTQVMRVIGRVSHVHETQSITSSTWYVTAVLVVSLFGDEAACLLAVAVLAFADPMAAQVGRRFGRHRLRNGRSLEGGLAFAMTAAVSSWGVLAWIDPGQSGRTAIALFVAVASASTELWSPVDDNLSIPIATAAAAMAAGALLG